MGTPVAASTATARCLGFRHSCPDPTVNARRSPSMRASTKIACGLILAAGVATAAQAQYHPYLPEQNTKEVDFAGSVTFEPVDSLALTGCLGYFVNRHLQVGLDGAYNRVSNGHSERVWSLGGFANWHFPGSSQMLPYVGGFLG